jgi:hypothetical protein
MTDSFSDKDTITKPSETEGPGILVFNEKRYAVGLDWFAAETHTENLINSRSGKLKADFYAIRSSIVIQHAFGYLSKGHRMGMPSAASVAADTLFGEWHGIFAADNGWWYLAVHSDAIAPDGDRLFTSEEEAYNYFIKRSKEYKWTRSYAPSVWNLPESVAEISLDKLLDGASSASIFLRPVNLNAIFGGPKQKMAALVLGILFLSLTLLIALLPAFANKNKLPSDYERDTIPIRIEAPDIIVPPPREVVKQPIQKINYAGLHLPVPSAYIGKCMSLLDQIVHPIPGWQLETVKCDNSIAEATWMNPGGSLEMLQEAMHVFPTEATRRYMGNGRFTVTVPVPSLHDFSVPVTVLPREEIILLLNKRLSSTGELKIHYVVPRITNQNAANRRITGQTEQRADPPFIQMELVSKMPPAMIATLFDLPGLNVQNITWNLKAKSWSYKAQVLIDSPELRQAQGVP